eukprot:m.145375 g.145375  ORF g.145375 m.145375 type:complete len:541 (-) comp30436_c0_seq3:417-2039(-)
MKMSTSTRLKPEFSPRKNGKSDQNSRNVRFLALSVIVVTLMVVLVQFVGLNSFLSTSSAHGGYGTQTSGERYFSGSLQMQMTGVVVWCVLSIIDMFIQQKQQNGDFIRFGVGEHLNMVSNLTVFAPLHHEHTQPSNDIRLRRPSNDGLLISHSLTHSTRLSARTRKVGRPISNIQQDEHLQAVFQPHIIEHGSSSVVLSWGKGGPQNDPSQSFRTSQHRRSCGRVHHPSGFNTSEADFAFSQRYQCCTDDEASSTPLKRLVLTSSQPFTVSELDQILGGGVITFVGDSIASQAYGALKERCFFEQYVVSKTAIIENPHATSLISIWKKAPSSAALVYCFSIELVRADKTGQLEVMVNKTLAVATVRRATTGIETAPHSLHAKQIVIVNVGLHFKDEHADRFRMVIRGFAKRMRLFNMMAHHYAFFRDITPQHFKSRSGSGAYAHRDVEATSCASAHVNNASKFGSHNILNEIMHEESEIHGIQVQQIHRMLVHRYDAHIESRNPKLGSNLDCTHWCVQGIFDAFEETMMPILRAAFGDSS